MSTRRAIGSVLLGVAVLGALAVPAMSMRLGLPDGSSEASGSTQYQAYTTVAEKFGAGVNGPLLVVADLPGSPTQDEVLAQQVRIGRQLSAFDDVVAVAPIGTSADGTDGRLPGGPGRRTDERLHGAARQGAPGGVAARRRRPDRRGRPGQREHRHLAEAGGRPAALPRPRRRTVAADHGGGVPVDLRPVDRDRRVHPVAVRGLRRGRGDLPVGLAGRDLRGPHRARS